MAWLDIVLLGIILLHLINGISRGLVKQLFDMLGFILILIISLWGSRMFSDSLAEYINPQDIIPHHDVIHQIGLDVALERAPQLIAGIIAFLVLFMFLSIVFRLFSGGFRWINRIPVIGFFNRLGGAILGILIGLVFVYIIIAALSLIPMDFFIEALEASEVVLFRNHYLAPLALELKDMIVNYYLNLNVLNG